MWTDVWSHLSNCKFFYILQKSDVHVRVTFPVFRGLITVSFFFHSDDEEIAISRVTIKYQKKNILIAILILNLQSLQILILMFGLNPYLISL